MYKRGIWLAVLAACFIIGSAHAIYELNPPTFDPSMTCGDTIVEIKELCVDSTQCAECCTCSGCGPYLEPEAAFSDWIKNIDPNPGHVECFYDNNCISFTVTYQVPSYHHTCGPNSFWLYAYGRIINPAGGDTCIYAKVDSQYVTITVYDDEDPTVACHVDWVNSADHLGTRSGPTGDTLVVRGGAAASFPHAQCNAGQAEAELTYSCTTADNCTSTCSCDPVSPHYFSVLNNGTPGQRVICTATDFCTNTAMCTFYVWVDTLEIPCNKIDDDCDTGQPGGGTDEKDPTCYDLVYVDDDWAGASAGDLVWTGTAGEEVRFLCNGFADLRTPIVNNMICGSQMWVHPGVYDIFAPPLAIGVHGLEIYSFEGPEVTIISCGCNALLIQADSVVIGDVGRGFTFTGNDNAITVDAGYVGTQIHHNHFCGNFGSAVRAPAAEVNAELNWWGHCTGPKHDPRNPVAQGDLVIGSGVDFDPWLNPCPVTYDDEVCMDHVGADDPEEFLLGSNRPLEDYYAVGYYNPGGEARLISVSFQFYDPGMIKAWVYLGPEGYCPPCGTLEPGMPPFDITTDVPDAVYPMDISKSDSLAKIPIGSPLFLGTWGWETVDLGGEGPCIQIPSKRCFYIVWQQDTREWPGTPRILGDAGHEETMSWIYNAELGGWKCFYGYEYMVNICLDYTPGCLEIHEADITWDHPQHGLYPCIDDPYTVKATFMNNCEDDAPLAMGFMEAPWGLFTMYTGYPADYDTSNNPWCYKFGTVPAGETMEFECPCEFYHYDFGNAWARNIILGWTRNINSCYPSFVYETGEKDMCLNTDDTYYFTRKCRMTIWPDSTWSKKPVRWGLSPIPIPVRNAEGRDMQFQLSVEKAQGYESWDCDLSWYDEVITPQDERIVYLTVRPNGEEPEGPVVIKVKAFKCNGEWGEVEIEFMPFTPKLNLQPVEITGLWWSPRYPCHDTPYDVWTEVLNTGTESAYPKISFGLAPWGLFFPVYDDWDGEGHIARKDTILEFGLGGGDSKIIAPYHRDVPFFQYHDEECTYYQGYYRNIVIDYPYVERHCDTVEVLTERYYRDCEAWMWPKHRWPWEPVAIPIPVFNELPYQDIIKLTVEKPDDWQYSLDKDFFELAPGTADTAWLSLIPGGDPPSAADEWPIDVYVNAIRAFCELESGMLHIKFMPFTGMCIPDYNGTIVEDPPGLVPTYAAGDEVQVSLMMENDYPVSAAQIDVHFDAALLQVVEEAGVLKVDKTTRTDGMQLAAYLIDPGHLRILIDSTPDPHILIAESTIGEDCQTGNPGNLSIATVWFLIKEGAPVGHCTDIVYGTVVLDGLPTWPDPFRPDIPIGPKEPLCLKYADKGQICFGGFVWPVRCDVTLDSMITLVDLFSILRHIIGSVPLTGDINVPGTPLWAADANGDHLINIIDLMKCINKAIGLPDPKVVAPDVFANDVVALPGRTVSVPVEVSSASDIAGLMLRLGYDADVLSVGQPQLTERSGEMLLDYGLVGDELVVLVSSLTGEVIDAGAGVVVRVPFEVADNADVDQAIEVAEPVVFTAEEQVVFGESSLIMLKLEDLIPAEYNLAQNYPNPFNPVTSIAYSLPEAAKVKVEVFNALGQVVTVLVDGNQDAGYHTFEWNADNMSSGVYFYRIQANDFTATKRMVLMK